jgi:hypothetical protein
MKESIGLLGHLRAEEVLEHPGLEHGDGLLRQAALRPPRLLVAPPELPQRPVLLNEGRLPAPLPVS